MSMAMEMGVLLPEVVLMAVRGALLLSCAGIVAFALRRSSAAQRHLVWAAAVVAVLSLPVLSAVTPGLSVPFPAISSAEPAAAAGVVAAADLPAGAEGVSSAGWELGEASAAPLQGAAARVPSGAAGVVSPGADGSEGGLPVASVLVFVWLLGVAVLLAPLAAGWIGVRRLAARSSDLSDARVRHLATRLALRIGLEREFRLATGPAGVMPMTWGIGRPTVLLPPEASAWPDSRLRAVLLHELAHVRRRDCLTQLLAELVRAFHWFDPLAWIAARRLRIEREHACDDVALAGGARPSDYADELLGLARSYRASAATSLAAVAMARPGQLADRLLAVLDESRRHGAAGRGAALRIGAGVAVLALVVAGAAPAAQSAVAAPDPRAAPPAPSAAAAREVWRSPEVPTAPEIPSAPEVPSAAEVSGAAEFSRAAEVSAPAVAGGQDPSCATGDHEWSQITHQTNDDLSTIRMQRRGCELEVRLEGDVRFDPVGMVVESLGRDGLLRIEEENGRTERYLEVRPGAGGAPSYAYRVDGRTAAFDGQAQAWYRSVLLTLFRRGGFAAEERVQAILDRGGVDAVLREMDQLGTDYVQHRYFRALMERASLDEGQFRTAIGLAIRHIESDHYLSEILRSVARNQALTGPLIGDFIAAALSMGSDHYRYETLKTALETGRLNGQQVSAVLEGADGMESDHYRAELLGGVASRFALEPAVRPAFLRAAAEIDSDHYRSEVLKRLVRLDDLTGAELREILAAVSVIESDHYLSELLVEVARRFRLEGGTRDAFLRAMDSLGSDHYRGRVADALLRAERG